MVFNTPTHQFVYEWGRGWTDTQGYFNWIYPMASPNNNTGFAWGMADTADVAWGMCRTSNSDHAHAQFRVEPIGYNIFIECGLTFIGLRT